MTQDEQVSRLVELCFDANDPLRLARFWADALGWEIDDEIGRDRAPADRWHQVRDRLPAGPGAEDGQEPHPSRSDHHVDRGPTRIGGEVGRAGRPPHRHRSAPRRGSCRARRPRRQRVLHHRAGEQLPRRLRTSRIDHLRRVARRSGTSGAWRWDGRWSGTRTRRPRSVPRTARGPFITWGPPVDPKLGKNRLHLDIAPDDARSISRRRSTASSPSERLESTSARARSIGWSWPILTATSSVS